MHSLKRHDILLSKAATMNQELIEFEKKWGSSNILPHVPVLKKLVSEQDIQCIPYDATHPLSMASTKTADVDYLCGNRQKESTPSSTTYLPSSGNCLGQIYSASQLDPLEEQKFQMDTNSNPVKSKIKRRDASDDLSPYFK